MRSNPREILLSLHRRHAKAWEQRNIEALRELYAPDVIVFNTDPPARFSDFKTFENTLQQQFVGLSEVSFLTSNIQIDVQENIAYLSSQYMKAFRENGRMTRENGRWTEVYVNDGQQWKIVHFHSSRDPHATD